MKRLMVFASLLLVALPAAGNLEARGFRHGRAARGFGRFRHHGGRAFGLGSYMNTQAPDIASRNFVIQVLGLDMARHLTV